MIGILAASIVNHSMNPPDEYAMETDFMPSMRNKQDNYDEDGIHALRAKLIRYDKPPSKR